MSNPIKPNFKTEILPILILVITSISAFYFYFHFPESVPVHWNIYGQPDRWSSRMEGAISIPILMTFMYLLFLGLPYFDPKKERYVEFSKVYHSFKNFMIFFMSVLYFIVGFNILGYDISIDVWVPFLIGLLFIFIGNYLGKIKRNWFVGIKTPWTLSSDEVWNKTHRFGGKVFLLSGLIFMVMGLLPAIWKMYLFVVAIILMTFGTMGYSYFVFLMEKKKNKLK